MALWHDFSPVSMRIMRTSLFHRLIECARMVPRRDASTVAKCKKGGHPFQSILLFKIRSIFWQQWRASFDTHICIQLFHMNMYACMPMYALSYININMLNLSSKWIYKKSLQYKFMTFKMITIFQCISMMTCAYFIWHIWHFEKTSHWISTFINIHMVIYKSSS